MVFCCPSCRCLVVTAIVGVLLFFGFAIIIASIRNQVQKSVDGLAYMTRGSEAWTKTAYDLGLTATPPAAAVKRSSSEDHIDYQTVYNVIDRAVNRLLSMTIEGDTSKE